MRLKFKILFNVFSRCLLLAACVGILGIGGYARHLIVGHNLHVVEPGQVYRSSRMSSEALAGVIKADGIKSILSLIGWDRAESDTAQRLGVQYFDFSISDRHEVTDEQIEKILTIIRGAPKPLLIHCKAGADRTGLVAALYLYAIKGQPAAGADKELTIRYGHLPAWLHLSVNNMDRSFWRYVSHHAAGGRN